LIFWQNSKFRTFSREIRYNLTFSNLFINQYFNIRYTFSCAKWNYEFQSWHKIPYVPVWHKISSVPVKILGKSKCGCSNITQWDNMAWAYGSDINGGNTANALLELGKHYGPVTSFTGVDRLYYPKQFELTVGGNSLQNRKSSGFKVHVLQCLLFDLT
jgi:hypothetical protein